MADVIDELWEANRQGWSLDKLERLVGITNRRAYCAACCDCAWRDYEGL